MSRQACQITLLAFAALMLAWFSVLDIQMPAGRRLAKLGGLDPVNYFAWLFSGRARLKTEVAMRIQPNPATLPCRPDLILWLEARKQSGGRLTLATASHICTAESVACYLGFFDELLGSDALVNLKGTRKRDALIARFGAGGFDFIGDSAADDSVWAACRIAHGAGNRPLPAAIRRTIAAEGQTFPNPGSGGFLAGFRSWVYAARLRQWVKNLLLFLPALLNRSLGHAWGPLLAAFFAFSFVASGPYVLNDLFDIEADRLHPTKRRRPFASVVLSIPAGLVTALILVVTGFAFSLLVYAVVSVTYSGFLKNKPVLDVVVLAFMYTWRVYVGGWFPKHGFRPG